MNQNSHTSFIKLHNNYDFETAKQLLYVFKSDQHFQ
jgi:hypothetical protein